MYEGHQGTQRHLVSLAFILVGFCLVLVAFIVILVGFCLILVAFIVILVAFCLVLVAFFVILVGFCLILVAFIVILVGFCHALVSINGVLFRSKARSEGEGDDLHRLFPAVGCDFDLCSGDSSILQIAA